MAGAISGLVVAVWLKKALAAGLPADVPQFRALSLDLRVVLFTLSLAVVTGLVFGVLPALSVWRTDPNRWLKEGSHGASPGAEHRRVRVALVVLQVSTSLMLLVGAGLLLRSFDRLLNTNPGFRPDRVMTGSIDLPETAYTRFEQGLAFYRSLIGRLRQTPGVIAAGGSTDLPLLGQWTHVFTPEGYKATPGGGLNHCNHSVIYGEYLQAMGIPLLRGRYFTDEDRPDSTHAVIVSEALAKKYWRGQDPIGKRLKWGPPEAPDVWMTVVGVVGDVKQGRLDTATAPHTYESYTQLAQLMSLRVAVRGQGDPSGLAAGLRAAVSSVDKQIAIGRPSTMEQVINRSTAARRFNLVLLGGFAAIALALAALGIYGLVAYAVTRRTHEVGVRMALGARSSDVVYLMLREGMPPVALGIGLGIAGAFALTRVLQASLYEVDPADSRTFALALLVLGATALAATYVPARRATRIEPVTALRHE